MIHPARTVARPLADLHAQAIGGGGAADPACVAGALQVLVHLGVTLADLQADPGPGRPTLAEYLPRVIAAASSRQAPDDRPEQTVAVEIAVAPMPVTARSTPGDRGSDLVSVVAR